MNVKTTINGLTTVGLMLSCFWLILPSTAWAHCDTLSGPVVIDAKKAIDTKAVDPVLKWIHPQDEDEIRSLFDKTLQARQKDNDVQELVDMHFFETLVRVHRAGEGAPYTGLKPADTQVEPGIEAAEEALESESDNAIVSALQAKLESSVSKRFQRVVEAAQNKDDNAAAGREYVEAYVDYIHYVERLYSTLATHSEHGELANGSFVGEEHSPTHLHSTQYGAGAKSQEKGIDVMQATDVLEREHGAVAVVLKAVREQARHIEHGNAPDTTFLREAIDFFRVFVDQCHHGKEEKHLFPRLQTRGLSGEAGPLVVLRREHGMARRAVDALEEAVTRYEKDGAGASGAVGECLLAYADLIEAHIDKEDSVLFPLSERLLTEEDQHLLVDGFEAIEKEELGEGVHERYHQWIQRLAAK